MLLAAACKQGSRPSGSNRQPDVLEHRSSFDLARLQFNENVMQLLSRSLDTTSDRFQDMRYEAFRERDSFRAGELPAHYFTLGQTRYFYRTLTLDSIARYDSIYFYEVGIETDAQKNLLAITARAKFREKKDLDSVLTHFFRKLGKTTEELAIKAEDQAQIDTLKARGTTDEEIAFLNLQGTQYNLLDYGDDAYFEWKLKDRYVQAGISKGREITMSTIPEQNTNEEYFYLDLLIIKKETYEQIATLQYERSLREKGDRQIIKPYKLHALNPEENWRLMQRMTAAWGR